MGMSFLHLPWNRRAFLAAVSGAVSASALAACRQGPERSGSAAATPARQITLTVAHAWEDAFLPTQEQFDQEFMKRHPNLKIELENSVFGEFRAKYAARAASGTLPDLLYTQYSWAQEFFRANIFRNLEPYIAKTRDFNLQDFTPPSLVAYRYQGALHLIPYDTGPYLLWYNKDLFDKAGIRYPSESWTMNDLFEAARAITRGDGPDRTWGFDSMPGINALLEPNFLRPFGASWIDQAETRMSLDSTEVVETLTWWLDFRLKHRITPMPEDTRGFERGAWLAGSIGMMIAGSWHAPTASRFAQFKYDVAHYPRGPRAQITGAAGSGYGITTQSKEPDAAWIYLNEYLSKEGQEFMWGRSGRGSPSRKSAWAAYESSPLAPPSAKIILPILTSYAEHVRPFGPMAPEMFSRAGPIWSQALTGQKAIKEALSEIRQAIEPLLAQNR